MYRRNNYGIFIFSEQETTLVSCLVEYFSQIIIYCLNLIFNFSLPE